MNTQKVWFVTGASKGLGLSLVKKLLDEGYKVAATSRTIEGLTRSIEPNENFLPLEVELTDESSVKSAIDRTVEKFGEINVVVNNAGYGQLGTIEELTDKDARNNFDVNIFGLLNVMRNVLPYLRKQGQGYIMNISSIAGFLGTFPGWGIYNATKFAVAGLTEAFSAEAASLGIKATIVYPGYFRTNFLSEGSLNLAKSPIADYKEAREVERMHVEDIIGNQTGDPEKAAQAFIELANLESAPLHFFMGSDSFAMSANKIEAVQKDLKENESLSKSTDF
ncbi:SDR family oxidoreductase [Chryseobacterium limigenitum]|uniref:NADP-dependent 3-hydroxy acid dehydrogenase YdfG n=1 Tax=Chryseobacterium limigenitum TaxID=1612149 RepID=A0A1K2IKI6_9FLAO|nr:SDR family oxidoreductase [Chryseobacterium limigenitum]SFZ92965.1 NADP-dependent 3-hydroxy acid dehydrogenase YdfG [Chryseobacterium limigenitum]